jgi:hypothetical protein
MPCDDGGSQPPYGSKRTSARTRQSRQLSFRQAPALLRRPRHHANRVPRPLRLPRWHVLRPANWVEWTMTISSSATSPCFSLTPLKPGWSTCPRGRSPTGTTWYKPSPVISKARTCALETPGISEAAASSRESLSGTTSGDSRSSASSCPTSPIRMSSVRSSLAPPAATW